jgi:PII-like signaling protein
MRLHGPAKRLTVFIGESDRHHHKPLYAEIVHRAHAAGLAGASVLRGIEGFGASQHVHTTRLLSLTEDLPIVIVMIDEADRIERFALELDALITEGLVVIDDVEVVRYVGRGAAGQGKPGRGESA